jgi:hypothetical protein
MALASKLIKEDHFLCVRHKDVRDNKTRQAKAHPARIIARTHSRNANLDKPDRHAKAPRAHTLAASDYSLVKEQSVPIGFSPAVPRLPQLSRGGKIIRKFLALSILPASFSDSPREGACARHSPIIPRFQSLQYP